jgi:hypothetical protein
MIFISLGQLVLNLVSQKACIRLNRRGSIILHSFDQRQHISMHSARLFVYWLPWRYLATKQLDSAWPDSEQVHSSDQYDLNTRAQITHYVHYGRQCKSSRLNCPLAPISVLRSIDRHVRYKTGLWETAALATNVKSSWRQIVFVLNLILHFQHSTKCVKSYTFRLVSVATRSVPR